ncbi:MAG: galactose oxidase-like domain-containing protein [Geminicoccaceae bacterium]
MLATACTRTKNNHKLLSLLMFLSLTFPSHPTSANNTVGAWSAVIDWPLVGIHATLLPDGRIMSYGANMEGVWNSEMIFDIWDPKSGFGADSHLTLPNQTAVDSFCSALILIPGGGEALTVGGNTPRAVNAFNFQDNDLRSTSPISQARWYGTATTLSDGNLLIQGGLGDGATIPEVYTPGGGSRLLTDAGSYELYDGGIWETYNENRWWYPRSWLAPDGRAFGITGSRMYFIDPAGSGTLLEVGTYDRSNLGATSTAVMFRPGQILQVGGGWFSSGIAIGSRIAPVGSRAATVIDINGGTPVLTDSNDMRYPRHWADATVLPDGQVLVNGGSRVVNELQGVAHAAELWNPETGEWTILASSQEARLYHSTSLLLADGSVLVQGGGAPGPVVNANAEIYYPAYLFNDAGSFASRPIIENNPSILDYGETFTLEVDDTLAIDRVTLIRTGGVTHSFNTDQRFMELSFTADTAGLTMTLPNDANRLPPGYYLLFVINDQGVPSEARIVRIDP